MKLTFLKKRKTESLEIQNLKEQYSEISILVKEAKQDMENAETLFNQADSRYVDVSVLHLQSKVKRYNILLQEAKEISARLNQRSRLSKTSY